MTDFSVRTTVSSCFGEDAKGSVRRAERMGMISYRRN
jgi:hypothetical protein